MTVRAKASRWLLPQPDTMLDIAAFGTVLAAAIYLILLGFGALLRPTPTKRFLEGFASSARVHFLELGLRLIAGAALLTSAPRMQFSALFTVFGWVLIGTTLVLAILPWRLHHRFATWSVPQATRYMPLFGAGSTAAGLALLVALVLPRTSS